MRVLSLDLGDVRVGIARSDLLKMIANPVQTYKRESLKRDIENFCKIIIENEADELVIGLPLNMDGTEGYRAQSAREIGKLIQEKLPNIKIVFQDERLSTVEAEDFLIQSNMRRQDRKKVIDQIAACIILQTYLDRRNK